MTLIQHTNCSTCRMSALCMPLALQNEDMDKLDEVIHRGRPFHKNDHIFRAGDDFKSVFAVRSGAIKTYCISDDGFEQVTGFHLPGEIFGWDGLHENSHFNSAVALETAAVCEIPYERIEELSKTIPTLHRHFMQLMSKDIIEEHQHITLLSKGNAEERIASLLTSFSDRLRRQKLSPTHFRIPMSRAEIGNYLGLTVETVSRVFSRFQSLALIKADKKEIEILQQCALRNLAHGKSNDAAS